MRLSGVAIGLNVWRIGAMREESLERLRLRIRLTEMLLDKRERAYHDATLHGSELQRIARLKKYRETANELARLRELLSKMEKEST